MSADHLLIWMSARGEGSWRQFRSAVEALNAAEDVSPENGDSGEAGARADLPLYQLMRLALSRLAHVEFTPSESDVRWRVVPPTLAITRRETDCVGILCGARAPNLSEKLNALPSTVLADVRPIPGAPDCIRLVVAKPDVLHYASEVMGLDVQEDAPAALLAAVPPVDDRRTRFSESAPSVPGWTIQRFSPRTLQWLDSERGDFVLTCTGLFRFDMKWDRRYYLRWNGSTFRVPVQVGKYAVLKRKRVRGFVHYDHRRALLSVPLMCRPPLLVERALILCSGLLPQLDSAIGRVTYSQVSPRVARLAAGLLRQKIEAQ